MKNLSAPHWLGENSVPLMMRRVLLALLPMTVASCWFFGSGILINAIFASILCAGLEVGMLRLFNKPVATYLGDGSALVTALLIALTLPPFTPWWVTATACVFAIALAKHLYGGLGQNLFNPAMIGYVAALACFPQYVADWPGAHSGQSWPDFAVSLAFFSNGNLLPGALDALTGATPLDSVKDQLAQMRTMDEITAQPSFGLLAGYGWEWINLAAAGGGIWLLRKRVISWHVPGAMLITLAGLYMFFYALAPAINPSPLLGLLSGGTMLAAFFIATDPVSGAASNTGRIIFGAGIGLLCFTMRKWGAYPDGLAFAVLFMNAAAPLIDRYTLPRVYGHRKRP